MKIQKIHIISISVSLVVAIISLFFMNNSNLFIFLIGIAIGISVLPFIISLIKESKRDAEISEMFLEFSRNLAESVKAGTPVSKSIVNLKGRNYGSLTPYVEKLANQIIIGIPVNKSLETFAYEVDNTVISRAVTLIREAEKAGGEIESILESSATSIAEIEKLKKERRAAISSLVVQGYLIFFIFIAIMLVMEFKIVPLAEGLGSFGFDFSNLDANALAKMAENQDKAEMMTSDQGVTISPFLLLLLAQGLFAGLMIGKLAEGSIKDGVKHSFILVMSAFIISTGSKLIFA